MKRGGAIVRYGELEAAIGHRWNNRALLRQALVHKSYGEEHDCGDNERLEFLGDAVLELVVTAAITEAFPRCSEGQLSRIRSGLVRTETLAEAAAEWRLGELLKMGKGEAASGGGRKGRLLAGAFEAVLGAIFLDGGYEAAAPIVQGVFKGRIARIEDPSTFGMDPKSALQEASMASIKELPEYRELEVTGPAHERHFTYEVKVGELVSAIGSGGSKQNAQRAAAIEALRLLRERRGEKR